jgi:hypothetical protein
LTTGQVDWICQDRGQVEVTKSGFFYHFKDKGELAVAPLQRYLENDAEPAPSIGRPTMKRDQQGNPVSYGNAAAIAAFDRTVMLTHAYQADPIAALDAVLAEHPRFAMAHAMRAGLLATATARTFEAELRRSVDAAVALWPEANERERGHIAAVRAWLAGDLEGAVEHWARVAIAFPRDGIAVQLTHLGDFYMGYSHMLRDRMARVLPRWSEAVPATCSACMPLASRRPATTPGPTRSAGAPSASTATTVGRRMR